MGLHNVCKKIKESEKKTQRTRKTRNVIKENTIKNFNEKNKLTELIK